MMGRAILETERLSLREITPDDFDDLLEIWGGPEPMRFFQRTLDRQSMREWIERHQSRYEQHGHGLWAAPLRGEVDCGSSRRSSGEVISASFTLLIGKRNWLRISFRMRASHRLRTLQF
jgi:RimJ/RimL family protein N-acetyltransferase